MVLVSLQLNPAKRADGRNAVRLYLWDGKTAKRYRTKITVRKSDLEKGKVWMRYGTTDHLKINDLLKKELQRARDLAYDNPEATSAELLVLLKQPEVVKAEKLVDALEAYLKEVEYDLTPGRVRGLKGYISHVRQTIPEARLKSLSTVDLRKVDRYLVEKGTKQNTRRAVFKGLRSMYRGACKLHGLPDANPFEGMIPAETDSTRRYFTPDQLERFASFTSENEGWIFARDMWMLAYSFGGMRFRELCLLPRSAYTEDALEWTAAKHSVERWVPLDDLARALILKYRTAKGNYLLPLVKHSDDRKVLDRRIDVMRSWINEKLRSVCYHAKVPRVTMHSARHTFAEEVATMDVRAASMVLGHRRLDTTKRYLSKFNRGMVREVFKKRKDGQ